MFEDLIPVYEEFNEFSQEEISEMMIVKSTRLHSDEGEVENLIRRIFVYAILTKTKDIHFEGRGDSNAPSVKISLNMPKGYLNFKYKGASGRIFESKMFTLTNTPQGGSTPEQLSARFSIVIPSRFARSYGLIPKDDNGYYVDLRVEYIRTFDGFAFTSRLLDQQRTPTLEGFGLSRSVYEEIDRAARRPSGLILVSGPTGSGKTTLLKAILDSINDGQSALFTIEDPVEFRIESDGPAKQINVGGSITFANALKTSLRMSSSIIMVGEIRDKETMKNALDAAQSGHLVISTVHATNGIDTISRAKSLLEHERVEVLRLGSILKMVIACRLLPAYEGEYRGRQVSYDEKGWLIDRGVYCHDRNGDVNIEGILSRKIFTEVVSSGKSSDKVSVVEAFYVDYEIQTEICKDNSSEDRIYELVSQQLQYESLPLCGVRAVESSNCKLSDCEVSLDVVSCAKIIPNLRSKLAFDYSLSFTEVNDAIDQFILERKNGSTKDLAWYLTEIKQCKIAV